MHTFGSLLGTRAAVHVQAAELGANVEGLLIAVKSTRDFEAEMAQKFGGGPAQPEPEEVRLQHNICHVCWKPSADMHHPLCPFRQHRKPW